MIEGALNASNCMLCSHKGLAKAVRVPRPSLSELQDDRFPKQLSLHFTLSAEGFSFGRQRNAKMSRAGYFLHFIKKR